jgi:hypothetical protein
VKPVIFKWPLAMVKALPSRPKRPSAAALFCARRVAAASTAHRTEADMVCRVAEVFDPSD